jgi:hypothetical protein
MSLLDELELRAGFEARAVLGARTLVAWAVERLLVVPRSPLRAELAAAALVAALGIDDDEGARTLAHLVAEGPPTDPTRALAACESSTRPALALEIADILAPLDRRPLVRLALGGIAERAGERERAAHAYQRARDEALAVGDRATADVARIELARVRLAEGAPARALDALAELGDTATLEPRGKLTVARAWLAASGRYRRCAALDLLGEILATSSPEAPEASAAVRLVAQHLDAVGAALTDAEADRVGALCARLRASSTRASGHHPDLAEALERALALHRADVAGREALRVRDALATEAGRWRLERARAVRDGGSPGPRPDAQALVPTWLALSVLSHLRARRVSEARRDLEELRRLAARETAPDAASWTALRAACRERALGDLARALAERWLDAASTSPPRGFVDLAASLERAGFEDLAGRALALARARHEPHARAWSIEHGIRRAWAAYDRGDPREARALLRTALDDASAGTGSRKA